ncbi:hypothetical protein TYRP_014426 [Tyrophagus putrescentiae]|nr:hypothetical protein TYRP_014426 [Tyrophagus putrescentiae]
MLLPFLLWGHFLQPFRYHLFLRVHLELHPVMHRLLALVVPIVLKHLVYHLEALEALLGLAEKVYNLFQGLLAIHFLQPGQPGLFLRENLHSHKQVQELRYHLNSNTIKRGLDAAPGKPYMKCFIS